MAVGEVPTVGEASALVTVGEAPDCGVLEPAPGVEPEGLVLATLFALLLVLVAPMIIAIVANKIAAITTHNPATIKRLRDFFC